MEERLTRMVIDLVVSLVCPMTVRAGSSLVSWQRWCCGDLAHLHGLLKLRHEPRAHILEHGIFNLVSDKKAWHAIRIIRCMSGTYLSFLRLWRHGEVRGP